MSTRHTTFTASIIAIALASCCCSCQSMPDDAVRVNRCPAGHNDLEPVSESTGTSIFSGMEDDEPEMYLLGKDGFLRCRTCGYTTDYPTWERESGDPKSFAVPLSSLMSEIPVPTPDLLNGEPEYSQTIKRGHVEHEYMRYWSKEPHDKVLSRLEAYLATAGVVVTNRNKSMLYEGGVIIKGKWKGFAVDFEVVIPTPGNTTHLRGSLEPTGRLDFNTTIVPLDKK